MMGDNSLLMGGMGWPCVSYPGGVTQPCCDGVWQPFLLVVVSGECVARLSSGGECCNPPGGGKSHNGSGECEVTLLQMVRSLLITLSEVWQPSWDYYTGKATNYPSFDV